MARRGELLVSSLGGDVESLAALHDYPRGKESVVLAYAQAADFVGFLLSEGGWHAIRVVLTRIEHGDPLDDAFERAFGRTLAVLEKEWRDEVFGWPSWVAVVTGSGALWGVITALFILAYIGARRRRNRRLVEMGEAEESIERLVSAVETRARAGERRTAAEASAAVRVDGAIRTLH